MQVKVYCDEELVFEGLLSVWLEQNENDAFLVTITNELNNTKSVTFEEVSGSWLIELV